MVKAGVVGASGFTGYELLRLLSGHYSVEIAFATSDEYQGKPVGSVFPSLSHIELNFVSHSRALEFTDVDVVFTALPHGKSAQYVEKFLKSGIRVIDLAGDSRFRSPETFKRWYGIDHPAPFYLHQVVYGIPEIFNKEVKRAHIVANPGCYPTSVIIPLYPIRNFIGPDVVVDSKSGVSGAGKTCSDKTHFVTVNENFFEYSVGRSHRHIGEMEEYLGKEVIFSAGLLPATRGILSTIYVRKGGSVNLYEKILEFYDGAPFVKVFKETTVSLKAALYSNNILISVFEDKNRAVIVSVIDNLIKGAAGQAVQNMNLMFGIDEAKGLPTGGIEI